MSDYELDEGVFDLPDSYSDGSMNALVYPRTGGDLRVFVSRFGAQKRELADLVEQRILDMRRRLPAFVLEGREQIVVDDERAIELASTFRDGELAMYQCLLCLLVGTRFVTIGVSGPESSREELDRMFDGAAATLSIRRQDAA